MFRGNDAFSGTRLRAGYSEGIKEPSFLQSFGISGTYPVLPNPNLQPEQNQSWEAGFEQGFWGNRLSLSALYYNNQFHNQIEFQTNPVDFTSQYVNLNKSMSHGAEVELRGQISSHFSFTGAYTYTSTRILEPRPAIRRSAIRSSTASARRCCAVPSRPGRCCSPTLARASARPSAPWRVGRRPDSDFLFGFIPPIYYAAGYARVDLGGWFNITRHVTAYANVEQCAEQSLQRGAGISGAEGQLPGGAALYAGWGITSKINGWSVNHGH